MNALKYTFAKQLGIGLVRTKIYELNFTFKIFLFLGLQIFIWFPLLMWQIFFPVSSKKKIFSLMMIHLLFFCMQLFSIFLYILFDQYDKTFGKLFFFFSLLRFFDVCFSCSLHISPNHWKMYCVHTA